MQSPSTDSCIEYVKRFGVLREDRPNINVK